MTFTITFRCEKGHTLVLKAPDLPDLPDRRWAEELARVITAKCSICDAPMKSTVSQAEN